MWFNNYLFILFVENSARLSLSRKHEGAVYALPVTAITTALEQCRRYLTSLEHEDIDCDVS